MTIAVAAFYRFAPLPNPAALRARLVAICAAGHVRGTVLLTPEGVNGTVAGPRAGVDAVLAHLSAVPGLSGLTPRWGEAPRMPFDRLRVRIKREIVTMGRMLASGDTVGDYVTPQDWNAVLDDPGTIVIDTRNAFEVAMGSFRGALDPGTDSFGDFPSWWAANGSAFAGRRVAMFCTGGIRCEKSTAFLRAQGVADVVHLQGGILHYLETVPKEASAWQGECFVFDQRVTVAHGLTPGTARMCHACRRPVAAPDTRRPEWQEGVQCHRCVGAFTDAQRARFRERQRQVDLAAATGRRHLGDGPG